MADTDHWITAVLSLRRAKNVVVFTGAGVSAESGIPTFRDDDGFWKRFPPERFATWAGLIEVAMGHPREMAEFVRNVVEPIAVAAPNAGHLAIADLARHVPTTVVTQNVDGLHQSAGSSNVHEIHGALSEVVDVSTGKVVRRFERDELIKLSETLQSYIEKRTSLPVFMMNLGRQFPLDWRGRHRPNLVLFGDSLAEPAWTNARNAADACDVFVSVGTSGEVYPAAMLPHRATAAGATVISIDPQPCVDCWLEGTAAAILPALVRDAFGAREGSKSSERSGPAQST